MATVGGWEPWARLVPRSIIIGENRAWGELIVDACSPEWRRVFAEALHWVSSRGFRGFMLDNLDVVDVYPRMKHCIADLVGLARRLYPRAPIMVNRGFSILERISHLIDYLLFEDFPSYYDASRREYRVYTGRDLAWLVSMLRRSEALAAHNGFEIILLAYGEPSDRRLVEKICRVIEEYNGGHPVYLAPWNLQSIGVCNPCRSTTRGTPRSPSPSTPSGERGGRPAAGSLAWLAGVAVGAGLAAFYAARRGRGR